MTSGMVVMDLVLDSFSFYVDNVDGLPNLFQNHKPYILPSYNPTWRRLK